MLNRLCVLALLALAGCAGYGDSIVTGTTKQAIKDSQVTFYQAPPPSFEVVGWVSASIDPGFTEQSSFDSAITELKHRAAKLGANGVLFYSSGARRPVGDIGAQHWSVPVHVKMIYARAIFVTERREP